MIEVVTISGLADALNMTIPQVRYLLKKASCFIDDKRVTVGQLSYRVFDDEDVIRLKEFLGLNKGNRPDPA